MKQKNTHKLILYLLTIGLLFDFYLVYKEITIGNQCPKIGEIPACFFVLLFFLIPVVSELLKKGNFLFYLFTGIGWALATYASSGELLGKVQCPTIGNEIPTCFIALTLFSIIIFLKIKSIITKTK